MTLYLTSYGSLNVTPVELDDLFDSEGQLTHSTRNIFPSEAAAVSCMGLWLSLELEEHTRQQDIKVKDLEYLKGRLDELLHSPQHADEDPTG